MASEAELRDTLAKLLRSFEEEQAAAQRSAKTTLFVLAVLLAVVIGSLSYLYNFYSGFTAEKVTGIVATQFEQSLPDLRQRVRDELVRQAPEAMAEARQHLLKLPVLLREELATILGAHTSGIVKKGQENLDKMLEENLDHQVALIKQTGGATTDQQVESIVKVSRDAYREGMKSMVEGMYEDYRREAHRLDQTLVRLQAGKNLTERERIEKELIEVWVALVYKHRILKPDEEDEWHPLVGSEERK